MPHTVHVASVLVACVSVGLAAVAVVTMPACGADDPSVAPVADAGSGDGGSSGIGFGDSGTGTPADAGGACIAPDMLITLDRTQSMHFTPDGVDPANTPAGHAMSKWAMAIEGVKQLTAAPLDQGVRFGLELWPKAVTGCISLAERIDGGQATNTQCLEGEVVVDTDVGSGAKITKLLDPDTTPICISTPTGSALLTASAYLSAHKADGAKQFVVLVTDGADWALSCPDPDPLVVVDQLKTAGVTTMIVGFSAEASLQGGVGAAFLNDMACAGGASKNFPAGCGKNADGAYRALDPDAGPSGTLFYVATNPTELATNVQALAKTVCCGCVK